MSLRIEIGLYWGGREEERQATASRLAGMTERLSTVDPLFSEWRKGASSEEQALRNPVFPTSAESFARELEAREREGGWSIFAWNGRPKPQGASFGIYVGSSVELANRLNITFPYRDEAPLAYERNTLEILFDSLIELWHPDHARVQYGRASRLGLAAPEDWAG